MKRGQIVYVVENNTIYEGEINFFLGDMQVRILINNGPHDSPTYVTKTYQVDFFETQYEAEKYLPSIIEAEKQKRELDIQRQVELESERKRQEEFRANKLMEDKKRQEAELAIKIKEAKKREEEIQESEIRAARKKTCESCGLPIGVFGHCGCSY